MADGVTDALREAILDGLLPASSWLREEELAAELKVSRTPVREALRRLTVEGLAVRAPNQGVQVAPMAIEDILAVYAVRENLEGLAARLAAQRAGDELAATLREAQARFEAAGAAGDVDRMLSLNLEFHRIIRQATGNQYLERFLTLVEHAVRRFGGTTFEAPGRRAETMREHGRIVDAIVERRAEDAEKLAMEHMRRARDARIQRFLESNAIGGRRGGAE
jgi:DNA-binding GntR family transcriptional regulator